MSVNKEVRGVRVRWDGRGVACMKGLLVVCPGRLRPPLCCRGTGVSPSQPPCSSPCALRLLSLVAAAAAGGGIVKVSGLLPGELPEKKLIFHVAQSSLFSITLPSFCFLNLTNPPVPRSHPPPALPARLLDKLILKPML